MEFCPDYEDLFKILNAYRIKYLVVGGQAVIFYTRPRYTKDMDVWVPAALNDPETVYQALKEFGVPLIDVVPEDFKDRKMILQIGLPPVRIDIMVSVPGISPKSAWKQRKKGLYGKTPIYVVGVSELIKAKKEAGRPMDFIDLDILLKVKKRKKKK